MKTYLLSLFSLCSHSLALPAGHIVRAVTVCDDSDVPDTSSLAAAASASVPVASGQASSVVASTAPSSVASSAPSSVASSGASSSSYTDYLFVYFTGEENASDEQIHMAVTSNNDVTTWTALNDDNPVLTSTIGTTGVRDPSMIRSEDGSKYWIIGTDLCVYCNGGNYDTTTGSKSIVIWESDDLSTWSDSYLAEVSPSDAGMTWAPDAIWDASASSFLVFWTSALSDGWFIMKSYTTDFKTFSTAEKYLTGAGMDVTIALDKSTGTFYRISKNGDGNLIEEASATSLDGTWTVVKDEIGSGTIPAGEGPLIFHDNKDSSKWHLFIDNYTEGTGYVPFETTDIASGDWTASEGYSFPGVTRHGYVIGITESERSALENITPN